VRKGDSYRNESRGGEQRRICLWQIMILALPKSAFHPTSSWENPDGSISFLSMKKV